MRLAALRSHTPGEGDRSNRARRKPTLLLTVALVTLVGAAASGPAAALAADNLPPVAVDDPGTACQPAGQFGGAYPIPEDWGEFDFVGPCGAIANDSDPDGLIVAWQIVTPPAHGTLLWLPTFPTVFGYTPAPDFSTPAGDWVSDSFTYQVIDNGGAVSNVATMRFWIAPLNDPPRFLSVPSVQVLENSGVYDASWLPYVSAGPANESSQTVHFIVTRVDTIGLPNLFRVAPSFTSDGHLTFTPGPDQVGLARITVYLQDDGGLEDYGAAAMRHLPDDTSDPVTFEILVRRPNSAPVAVDDSATIAEDSSANTIAVLANDTDVDGDALVVTSATSGTKGTVAISGGGTAVTYTPNPNVNGSDSFTYVISDGHGESATGTVHVGITPVNDAPMAIDDSATFDEDSGTHTIDVLGNDTDIDGGALTVTQAGGAANGSVAIASGGAAVIYTPSPNTNGPDSFTYTITDGNGGTATATVHVGINPVNDPPDARDDGSPTSIKIGRGAGPISISVLANDTSAPDGPEDLRITSVTQGSHGAVAVGPGGASLTYDPIGMFTGFDTFSYTISDGNGGIDTATVRVEVAKDATAPTVSQPVIGPDRPIESGKVRLTVSWTAQDPESGIASSQLQLRRDGKDWSSVTLADPMALQASVLVAPGHTYEFRVRATNGGSPSSTSPYSVSIAVRV